MKARIYWLCATAAAFASRMKCRKRAKPCRITFGTWKRASAQLRGGIVEVERTKHLYQADEFFGLGIKGVAGAWRLAELIDVGRSQRLHDQPALVLIDFDVVAHLILLNAAGPRPRRATCSAASSSTRCE